MANWWLSRPSEKYEIVTWDDEIPIFMFQTTNQENYGQALDFWVPNFPTHFPWISCNRLHCNIHPNSIQILDVSWPLQSDLTYSVV